jgi:hypothetical protein
MNNPKHIYIYDKIPKNIAENLSSDEIRMVSFFSSKTMEIMAKLSNDFYIPFSKCFASSVFGKYHKSLSRLLELGILKAKVIGASKDGKPLTYSKDNNICKSYRLSDSCIKSLKRGEYTKNELKLPFVYNPKNPPIKVNIISDSESALIPKLAKAFEGLNVSENWQDSFDGKNESADFSQYQAAKTYTSRINKRQIKISIPPSGRIYHPLICMNRIFRPFVTKDGEKLLVIDGKAFHPHLLASFLSEKNKRRYLDFLAANDIYSLFMQGDHPKGSDAYDKERDRVKKCFMIFLGDKRIFGTSKEIQQWFAANYPEIIFKQKELKRTGGTMQMTLQKIESDIFINRIFANATFWTIPMHDAIAILPNDKEEAEKFCAEQIRQCLGYDIKLEIEPL